jgi:hypothetical protein
VKVKSLTFDEIKIIESIYNLLVVHSLHVISRFVGVIIRLEKKIKKIQITTFLASMLDRFPAKKITIISQNH